MAQTVYQTSHHAAARLGWQTVAATVAAAGAIALLLSVSAAGLERPAVSDITSAADDAAMAEDWGPVGPLPAWLHVKLAGTPFVTLEPGWRIAVPVGSNTEVREIPSFPLDLGMVTQKDGWVTNRSDVPVEVRIYRP